MTTPRIEISINLAALQAFPLRKLQRLVDILEFVRAGGDSLSLDDYPKQFAFLAVYPSNNTRLSHADAKTAAEAWCAHHCLRDALEVLSLFLEEVQRCCATYKLGTKPTFTAAALEEAQARSVPFHRLGLPRKIQELEREYGIRLTFAPHVVSLNEARNCLVHRDGIVAPLDTNDGERLTVTWYQAQVELVSPDGKETRPLVEPTMVEEAWNVQLKTGPVSKSFALQAPVLFTYAELAAILFTCLGFVNEVSVAVQKYAKGLGIPFAPPKPAA